MSACVDVLSVLVQAGQREVDAGQANIAQMAAHAAVADLFQKGRHLSADLEHAIAIANVDSPDAVHVRHPIRLALDQFDEALRAAGGAA
ncbi:hypothetical protein P2A67_15845 [Xanthomonas perforans]|uniref:hypothetical protein n=1 Tax=Xanthomonas perforans TaxID=442694 RepID=UPI000F8D1DC0|nr:hypothetical protein [Xanthomonas perforans]MDS6449132.1 hypothetical protein [Xanthomonas perforans]MDS6452726.1 hypothetical protein [Xanthomonas perforans]MDS6458334.1 hypothetical protein [Xanthomonas perforans]MDS6464773.1 hypothetical protein [Xanthomonas perforans]MDS6469005.1 hypothetical protein [Xanthomonas perforans]